VVKPGVRRFPRGLRDSKQLAEEVREQLFEPVAKWCEAWAVGHTTAQECDLIGMTRALRLAARRAFQALPDDALPDAVVLDGSFDFLSPRPDPKLKSPRDDRQEEFDFSRPDVLDAGFGQVEAALEEDLDRSAEAFYEAGGTEVDTSLAALDEVRMPDGRCPEVTTVVKGDDICASVAAASVLAKVTRDRLMRQDAPCYPAFDFENNKGYPTPTHKIALRGYGLTAIHRRSWAFVDWLPLRPVWSQRLEPEGSFGIPSTRSATMFRSTSSVPPAIRIPGTPRT
jgi:ribonuclease HII